MKYVIASDLHGSAYYCKLLLDAFEREGADRLLLLGDILYHGPRNDLPRDYSPKAVAEMLNGVKNSILCVRGNCDSEVDQMVLDFPIMAEYAILDLGEKLVFATHGHLFHENRPPMLRKGDILLHGHTHVQVCRPFGENIYMNPGSLSIPKEDSVCGYMTLEDRKFIWKALEDGQVLREYSV